MAKQPVNEPSPMNADQAIASFQKTPLAVKIRLHIWAVCFLGLPIAFCASNTQQKGPSGLEPVLKQMEAAGRNFRSFSAKFSQKKYTAVLREFGTPDTGDFYYSRAKDGSALLRREITHPGREILTIKGGVAAYYQPEIKQAHIYNLGKDKDKAEYLALGIGQSPAKLQETFDISFQGSESIGGAACSILVLKPKTSGVSALYSSITLWVKKQSGIPIQHKFLEPSGDYLLMSFSNEKLNLKIPDSIFEQKLAGVEIQ
jgi:outer membrane lipoprotein-sorting protein